MNGHFSLWPLLLTTDHFSIFRFGLETLELAVKDGSGFGAPARVSLHLISLHQGWGGGASFCLAARPLSVLIKGGALEPFLHAVPLLLLGPIFPVDHGPRPGHALHFTIRHS